MFWKRRRRDETIKEKAAVSIAKLLLKAQTMFADQMTSVTKHISLKKMKIILIAFCVSAGGYSFYIIARAVLHKDKAESVFHIDSVIIPSHYDQRIEESLRTDLYVDDEGFETMKMFEKYMDSLQLTTEGMVIYDSILKLRPKLMDSIQILKEIYQSNKMNLWKE